MWNLQNGWVVQKKTGDDADKSSSVSRSSSSSSKASLDSVLDEDDVGKVEKWFPDQIKEEIVKVRLELQDLNKHSNDKQLIQDGAASAEGLGHTDAMEQLENARRQIELLAGKNCDAYGAVCHIIETLDKAQMNSSTAEKEINKMLRRGGVIK